MSSRLRTRLRAGTGLATASLSLEFATASGALDPRITFSRGSQATVTDATGKLTYAPNNLLTNSETFEAASWNKANASVSANASVAPDGTTTADVMTSSAAAGYIYPATNLFSAAGGGSFIASVYAKAGTATSFQILLAGVANYTGTFNLSTGVASTSTANTSVLMTAVGNGWYRCAMVCTSVASIGYAELQIGRIASTLTLNLWGAQLEQVTYQTTPGTYNSTSPKNLLGYTQEFDNAAWTKSNAFVQTNLLTYSQAFDNAAWTKTLATIAADAISAPDGTATADAMTEVASSGPHLALQSASFVSGTEYTFSLHVKPGLRTWVYVQLPGAAFSTVKTSFYDLTGAGALGTATGSPTNRTILALGDGWYQITMTATATATTSGNIEIRAASNGSTTVYTGSAASPALYLWGAQLVQGSTAGDYQRTDAAAAAVQYTAPDGSRTADKLVEDTANAWHGPRQAVGSGTVGVFSFYAKAAERSRVWVAGDTPDFVAAVAVFNLANGTVQSGTGTIQDAGNGWYRCSIAVTVSARGCSIAIANDAGTVIRAGDGTSGVLLWGAQLSNSASLDAYSYNPVAAPTSAAYYGPRFDYDPIRLTQKGLLIEEQRTNLLTYSEQFDNGAWSPVDATISANVTLAPSGTVAADAMVESATNNVHTIFQSPAISASTTYTWTVYAKRGVGSRNLYLQANFNSGTLGAGFAWFDLASGVAAAPATLTAPFTGVSSSMTPVGNGWYRCSFTFTTNAGNTSVTCYTAIYNSGRVYAGDGTSSIYIYGAQLEAGSFATSYIPTVASQVTRTADVALMQGANFSNWYNQNEGTFVAEFDTADGSDSAVLSATNGGTNYNRIWMWTGTPNILRYSVVLGAVTQSELTGPTVTLNSVVKTAAAYRTNDFAFSTNGGAVGTDTSGNVIFATRFDIGQELGAIPLNGHISRIGYYPTRLSNEQLQALTAQSTIPSLSLDFTTQVFNVG